MRDAVCVVTGASSGIGLEAADMLARAGSRVLMVARDPERGARAVDAVARHASSEPELQLADFGRFRDVRDLAERIARSEPHIDVLVNNAGLLSPTRTITQDGNELTFQVNHLSHFLLTNLLLGTLEAAPRARVVTVSSSTHHFAFRGIRFSDLTFEKGYEGFAAYTHSKLANIMFAYELARRTEAGRVTSNVLNPGLVGTHFGMSERGVVKAFYTVARPFILSAAQGADSVVHCATATELDGVTGTYFQKTRPRSSSRVSYDRLQWRELWETSAALTSLDRVAD
jgi:NAD(P)-dependent dehydrogenase (short-subunit alcohol dehydrogenase family)